MSWRDRSGDEVHPAVMSIMLGNGPEFIEKLALEESCPPSHCKSTWFYLKVSAKVHCLEMAAHPNSATQGAKQLKGNNSCALENSQKIKLVPGQVTVVYPTIKICLQWDRGPESSALESSAMERKLTWEPQLMVPSSPVRFCWMSFVPSLVIHL